MAQPCDWPNHSVDVASHFLVACHWLDLQILLNTAILLAKTASQWRHSLYKGRLLMLEGRFLKHYNSVHLPPATTSKEDNLSDFLVLSWKFIGDWWDWHYNRNSYITCVRGSWPLFPFLPLLSIISDHGFGHCDVVLALNMLKRNIIKHQYRQ